jgi:hypothetical protein
MLYSVSELSVDSDVRDEVRLLRLKLETES